MNDAIDSRRLLWPTLLLSALAALLSGCKSSPCGNESFFRTVTTATAKGQRWTTANFNVSFVPGHSHGDGYSNAHVGYILEVTGPAGRDFVNLDENLPDSDSNCHPTVRLAMAPDGHAVALSRDEGQSWTYVAFDTSPPLYCPHRAGLSSADLWSAAPTTAAFATERLKTATDAASALAHAGRLDWRYEGELEAAATYVCAHADEAPLAQTLQAGTQVVERIPTADRDAKF